MPEGRTTDLQRREDSRVQYLARPDCGELEESHAPPPGAMRDLEVIEGDTKISSARPDGVVA